MIVFGFVFLSICIIICSGLMVAYANANKIYLNIESKKTESNNNYLKTVTEQPYLFIGSLKICISVFVTLHALLFFTHFYQPSTFKSIWLTIIYIFFMYLFTKFIPQTLFKPFANETLIASKPIIEILLKIFGNTAAIFIKISEKLLPGKTSISTTNFNLLSSGDLGTYISQQIKASNQQEQLENEFEILKNALSFPKVKVKEIMTPKNEFEYVNENDSIDIIRKKFVDTGFSKIIVVNTTNEHYIGYLHTYDLLQLQQPIDKTIRAFIYVYEDLLIKDLLNTLTLRKKSIALVKNQENDIVGLITLEDIIEELFGEITDEHDDTLIAKQIGENNYIFSAQLDLDDINEKFNLQIPTSEHYNSLGGFIYHNLQRHPKTKETVSIKSFKIKILSATNTRIKTVALTKKTINQ